MVKRNRSFLFVLITVYIFVLKWAFENWTVPVWNYLGFSFSQKLGDDMIHTCIVFVFMLLPTFWIPIRVARPSMIIYWILYLMTIIPALLGVGYSIYFTKNQIYSFFISLDLSFFICGFSYFFTLINFSTYRIKRSYFWFVFFLITFILLSYTVYVFKGNLQLMTFFSPDLYSFRFTGRDIEAENPLVGYFILWLSGSFFSFSLSYGIINKKRKYILISILGQIIVYMTLANKAFILSIFFMLLIHTIIKKTYYFGYIFTSILIFLMLSLASSQLFFEENLLTLALSPLTAMLFVRTLGVSSLTSSLYYDFFQTHPHTYFANKNVVNLFIQNPYKNEMMGVVIGDYYTAIDKFNINANFFITDGIVTLGLLGMPIISIACCLLFYLIDSVSFKHNLNFSILVFSYSAINMMNVSLFTSFISGGLFFTIAFLIFFEPSTEISK